MDDKDPSTASDRQSQVDSGWLPFDFISEHAPIVSFLAAVNESHDVRLTLDTGNSSGLHISEAAARRLGLVFSQPIDEEHSKASVGSDLTPTAFKATFNSIAIGNWILHDQSVIISSYVDHLATNVSDKWEANIGFEVFGYLCVSVDYPGKRLRFCQTPVSQDSAEPFRLGETPWIIVTARINGEEARNFILDTGAGGTLISPEVADQLGVELGEAVDMLGATGMEAARYARISDLRIGQKTVHSMQIVVGDIVKPLSQAAGLELAGIIGYDFFQDSVLMIDYGRRLIGFQ